MALKYDQEDVVNFIRALDLYDAAKQGDIGVFDHLDPRRREHMVGVWYWMAFSGVLYDDFNCSYG